MKKILREWGEALIYSVALICLLNLFCWPVRVEGLSMEKTLPAGSRILMSKALASMKGYGHGDLVIVNIALDGKRTRIVKRVIALEGETVSVMNGTLFVNGSILKEPYVLGKTQDFSYSVPDGYVFVMGDNREHSTDSRDFGPVKTHDVTGKVICRVLPWPLQFF